MKRKIGFLLPYSGEFPELKRALLSPLQAYAKANDADIAIEFVNKGEVVAVEKALDKLYYNDDVDIVIAYINYRVSVNVFEKLRRYPEKPFINLSLGEIIPYTNSLVNYPPNYFLITYDAWKAGAVLGNWIAESLPAQNCLICTSQYDAGYSLQESFRIGYHSKSEKKLSLCILREINGIDTSGLFEEINRVKPDHLHIILIGRQLSDFILRFKDLVNYNPSVSFAFPVSVNSLRSDHPSLREAFTALPNCIQTDSFAGLEENTFQYILSALMTKALEMIEDKYVAKPENVSILKMNLEEGHILSTGISRLVPGELNEDFNHSAENSLSILQNPYLCI